MNTLTHPRTLQPLLRRAFTLDAIATGGMGLALALGADALQSWVNLPAMLLREAGLICVLFAGWLAFALMRPVLTQAMATFAVSVNILWVLASVGLLASGWVQPTQWGALFVAAQAITVAVFALLQYLGARRAFH